MGVYEIPLTRGYCATVDAVDFRQVMKHKWCLLRKQNGDLYAQSNMKIEGKWVRILLHRFIMQAEKGSQIDHRNGNGLDCTRSNLRVATHAQNLHNQKARKGSSRFKGVSWHEKAKKWLAQIRCQGQHHYLGLHVTEEEAARAYDTKATELHGEFAWLNFPAT